MPNLFGVIFCCQACSIIMWHQLILKLKILSVILIFPANKVQIKEYTQGNKTNTRLSFVHLSEMLSITFW